MDPKPAQTRVIPESALLHFAFSQRQYVAVLNAVQYFAKKLQHPAQREIAQSALAVLMTPSAFSLPSEAEDASVHEVRDAAPPTQSQKDTVTHHFIEVPDNAPPRGIEALRGGKK